MPVEMNGNACTDSPTLAVIGRICSSVKINLECKLSDFELITKMLKSLNMCKR